MHFNFQNNSAYVHYHETIIVLRTKSKTPQTALGCMEICLKTCRFHISWLQSFIMYSLHKKCRLGLLYKFLDRVQSTNQPIIHPLTSAHPFKHYLGWEYNKLTLRCLCPVYQLRHVECVDSAPVVHRTM